MKNYRVLDNQLRERMKRSSKVLVLLGARQVGKTTLLKRVFPEAVYINLEKSDYIDVFNRRNVDEMKAVFNREGGKSDGLLILDEAQRLDSPGLVAKLIHDELGSKTRLIMSGSSALEIANKTSESLAGRKETFCLYPLSLQERLVQKGFSLDEIKLQEFRGEILESMRYGMYPDLLNVDEKSRYLLELMDSALLKDVLYLNLVKNTTNLFNLLKLLAYQVGQVVNVSDLANRLGIARPTVIDYIEIFKKMFVIYTLPPFRKKRRDEVGKQEKIYFYDLGIRNAVINDFSAVEYRQDFGCLFENFVMSEMLKKINYEKTGQKMYFWRTKWGSEVDLVLEKDGQLAAMEVKLRTGVVTKSFTDTYPRAEAKVVNLESLRELLL